MDLHWEKAHGWTRDIHLWLLPETEEERDEKKHRDSAYQRNVQTRFFQSWFMFIVTEFMRFEQSDIQQLLSTLHKERHCIIYTMKPSIDLHWRSASLLDCIAWHYQTSIADHREDRRYGCICLSKQRTNVLLFRSRRLAKGYLNMILNQWHGNRPFDFFVVILMKTSVG